MLRNLVYEGMGLVRSITQLSPVYEWILSMVMGLSYP